MIKFVKFDKYNVVIVNKSHKLSDDEKKAIAEKKASRKKETGQWATRRNWILGLEMKLLNTNYKWGQDVNQLYYLLVRVNKFLMKRFLLHSWQVQQAQPAPAQAKICDFEATPPSILDFQTIC